MACIKSFLPEPEVLPKLFCLSVLWSLFLSKRDINETTWNVPEYHSLYHTSHGKYAETVLKPLLNTLFLFIEVHYDYMQGILLISRGIL